MKKMDATPFSHGGYWHCVLRLDNFSWSSISRPRRIIQFLGSCGGDFVTVTGACETSSFPIEQEMHGEHVECLTSSCFDTVFISCPLFLCRDGSTLHTVRNFNTRTAIYIYIYIIYSTAHLIGNEQLAEASKD